jgi:hypothetical protein
VLEQGTGVGRSTLAGVNTKWHRDIGNSVDTGLIQSDILISETLIRDKAVSLWYNGHMDQELSLKG